jgi:hypothetical protein
MNLGQSKTVLWSFPSIEFIAAMRNGKAIRSC